MEEDRLETRLEWKAYLKGNWPRIRRQSFNLAQSWMDSLHLANTAGEELLFSKALYRVTDEAAVTAALESYPAFEPADTTPGSFVWLNESRTVMGNVRVGAAALELECNSKERLERGKLLLSDIAGQSLRHLRDEFTTQKELKKRAMSGPPGPRRDEGPNEIPKELQHELIGRYLEDHYGKWPDIALPALGGKTPREAARTPKGRTQLIALLKDIENGEDRKRRDGEPFYDVSRLRAELGLND
jgi:hypothetical protein